MKFELRFTLYNVTFNKRNLYGNFNQFRVSNVILKKAVPEELKNN